MDRNEAVQKLSKVARISVAYAENLHDSFLPKPVVPQYVADWYEVHKNEFYLNLHRVVRDFFEHLNADYFNENPIDYDFACWYYNTKNAIQILVNMHQFGYEVEKEKRYTVRFNNFKAIESYLKQDLVKQKYYLGDKSTSRSIVLTHTRKELEDADFGWVFNCEGIEVKEVK